MRRGPTRVRLHAAVIAAITAIWYTIRTPHAANTQVTMDGV